MQQRICAKTILTGGEINVRAWLRVFTVKLLDLMGINVDIALVASRLTAEKLNLDRLSRRLRDMDQ